MIEQSQAPSSIETDLIVHENSVEQRITIQLLPQASLGGSTDMVDRSLRHGGQDFTAEEPEINDDTIRVLRPLTSADFPHLAGAPYFHLRQRYQRFSIEPPLAALAKSFAENPLVFDYLYLFNVIVALEWQPSRDTIEVLMQAFRGASDVLYDATNGGMAFGQVVFAGPQLMSRADVQIMASNRFHPRSTVDGLNTEEKFSPIRLGRGLWKKNNHLLLPWSETIACRAIAHEWAHYALSLRDEYIDDAKRVGQSANPYRLVDQPDGSTSIVVPRVRLSVETLMETLDSSELVSLQGDSTTIRQQILNQIERYYSGIADRLSQLNPGPYRFPGALPQFYTTSDLEANSESASALIPDEICCSVDNLDLDHGWLYSLGWEGDTPQIVAQGVIDDRARKKPDAQRGLTIPGAGFNLFGARSHKTLIAIGLSPTEVVKDGVTYKQAVVRTAEIPAHAAADKLAKPELNWLEPSSGLPPIVSVFPPQGDTTDWRKLTVQVRIVGPQPDKVWLAEPGGNPAVELKRDGDTDIYSAPGGGYQPISGLDGIMLLQFGPTTFWVSEYSHGGNPPTTVRTANAPISAGSSDGNLMIFCKTDGKPNKDDDAFKTSIITTRNYASFDTKLPGRPASYLFSVATNRRLDDARLKPTIVMYYDAGALDEEGQLGVFRYDTQSNAWQPLPTYLPGGGFYAATPINKDTAPSLVIADNGADPRLEYYRLFLVKHDSTTLS